MNRPGTHQFTAETPSSRTTQRRSTEQRIFAGLPYSLPTIWRHGRKRLSRKDSEHEEIRINRSDSTLCPNPARPALCFSFLSAMGIWGYLQFAVTRRSAAVSFTPNPMRTRCERDGNPIVIGVPSGSDRVRIGFGMEEVAWKGGRSGVCPKAVGPSGEQPLFQIRRKGLAAR